MGWRTKGKKYDNRPLINGYQTFSVLDITSKYLQELITSAEWIIGPVTSVVTVLPNGQNLRTTPRRIINHELWGNFTSYVRVYVDGHDPQETEHAMKQAFAAGTRGSASELYQRASAAIFPFDNGMEYSRAFLIYRLGSSTFEASVHRVAGGDFDTLSSVYNQHLSGNDFTQRVVDRLLLAHQNKTGQDLSGDVIFLSRLRSEVEKAKQVLSVRDWVLIETESL